MNKKAVVFLLASMFIQTMATESQGLKCEIGFFNMEPSGYLAPAEKTVSISTKIVSDENFDLKNCQSITQGQLQISLCAISTEAQGVVRAELLLQDLKNKENINSAYTILGTSKIVGQDMIDLAGHDAVSPALIQRLGASGIEIQTQYQGDSLRMDDANKLAAQRGLIKTSEIAVVQLLRCK